MPRPFCPRRIAGQPAATLFEPADTPRLPLDEVVLTLDEFEALRLADLDKLYHARAARQMRVSRPTFSRILDAAHAKIADALVHGKALRIEGGPVRVQAGPRRCCRRHDPVAAAPASGERSSVNEPAPHTSIPHETLHARHLR